MEVTLFRAATSQHPSHTQILIDIRPMNPHRHDLEILPLRWGSGLERGYQSSGVAMRRPSTNVTTSSVAVKATEDGRRLPTSISKVLIPRFHELAAMDPQVADNIARLVRGILMRSTGRATSSVGSPPPCGEGLGVGVHHSCAVAPQTRPPPRRSLCSRRPSPQGEGKDRVCGTAATSHHNGKLSCFRPAISTCLPRSIASARATRLRVACGMITSSM
jgi:hypothetical protein